jgi:leader peptidase (prepilin peptidase)/N-methyltransferase
MIGGVEVAAVLALTGAPLAAALVTATLPTAAYRLSVPWGTPPLAGCPACERPFRAGWPGWLRLGAACPACSARTGPSPGRWGAIAALAAAGFGWRFGASLTLVPFVALVPFCCLLCAIDLACHRLPERLVLPGIGVAVVAFGPIAAVGGTWGAWGRAILGGLAFGLGYLLLAVISLGQLGGGDVTLGILLGIFLGWLGWPFVILGMGLPFAVNAPVAIWFLVSGRAGRRSELPFGPAMVVGAYLAVLGPALAARILTQ